MPKEKGCYEFQETECQKNQFFSKDQIRKKQDSWYQRSQKKLEKGQSFLINFSKFFFGNRRFVAILFENN